MSGVRVLNIPLGTTEKDIKIHFSNPKNGGRKLSRIYFPLQGNDAVLFYHDDTVSAKSFKTSGALQLKGNTIIVRDLPRKVFNKVTVELDQSVTKHLDENSSYLDELQFDGDLEMTFDPDTMNYIMSGDWYQVEWALAYLDNMCGETSDLNQHSDMVAQADKRELADDTNWYDDEPGTNRKKDTGLANRVEEFHQRSPRNVVKEFDFKSTIKSMPSSENKIGGGLWENETKSHKENIPRKQSKYNATGTSPNVESTDIQSSFDDNVTNMYAAGYKPELKNLFAQRGKAGSYDRKNDFGADFGQETRDIWPNSLQEYAGSFGDDDRENDNLTQNRFLRPGQRRSQRRQQGMSMSHSDFSDIPLKLDIHVEAVRVLVTLGDIIEETTDAIVNPCNTDLANTYGISKAIATAAGKGLQEECKQYISKKEHMVFGDVIHTCAGGMLKKRVGFVVHAAGPTWRDDQGEQSTHMLTCTYLNCFQYANKHLWLRSLSLPLISAGIHGCPLDASVQAFYDALLLHTVDDKQSRHLQEIHLVSNDPDSTCAIIVVLNSLMDLDQAQAKSAAIERYQKNCAQFEFSANQFDMFVDRETHSDESYSSESETDQTPEEANDNRNIESRSKSPKEREVAGDVNVDDVIAMKNVPTTKDDVSTSSSDVLPGDAVKDKSADDSDVIDDDSSDYSDQDQDEAESRQIFEDDEVPMGVVNMSDEDMFESRAEVRAQESEINKTLSDQEKEVKVAGRENIDDDKDLPNATTDNEDTMVQERPIDEVSGQDEGKKRSPKIAESEV